MKRVEQRGAARKNKLRQLFGQKYAFNELGGDARPYGIMEMMEWIRKHGLEEEGIFRKSGNADDIEKLVRQFSKQTDKEVDLDQFDVHTVAGALLLQKKWVRDMPNPIMTNELYDAWITGIRDLPGRIRAARACLKLLPTEHRALLKDLVKFFTDITARAETNLMTSNNVAIVFGPNMLQAPASADPLRALEEQSIVKDVIITLIDYYAPIFEAPIFTIDMLRSTGDHGEAGGAENTAAADEHEESKGDGGKQRKKAPRPRPLQRQPTLEEAMFLNSLRTGALSMMKSIALVQRKESMSHIDLHCIADVSANMEESEGGATNDSGSGSGSDDAGGVKSTDDSDNGANRGTDQDAAAISTPPSRRGRDRKKSMQSAPIPGNLVRDDGSTGFREHAAAVTALRASLRKRMAEGVEWEDLAALGVRPRIGSIEKLTRTRSGAVDLEADLEAYNAKRKEERRLKREAAIAAAQGSSELEESVRDADDDDEHRGVQTRERQNAVVEPISIDDVLECAIGGSMDHVMDLMSTMSADDIVAFDRALSEYEMRMCAAPGLTSTTVAGSVTTVCFANQSEVTVEWLWQ